MQESRSTGASRGVLGFVCGVLGFVCCGLAFAAWPAGAHAAEIVNTFDAGAQGWRTGLTDSTSCTAETLSPASWSAAGGNPGGDISGVDVTDPPGPCPWAFVGPESLAGVRTANYGGTASFDLRYSATANNAPFLTLTDAQGHHLFVDTATVPLTDQWTTYSIPIAVNTNPTPIWEFTPDGSTFTTATEADFIDVLSDLSFVGITGELANAGTGATTALDNFKLTNGPPRDTDLDGLTDTVDSCPLVAGPVTNNGCPVGPDSDGDGVPDASDQCPAQSGPATNNGCPVPPDTDGDTVPDASDQCPGDFGPPANNGCPVVPANPDPDGDGLIGAADKCPSQAGPAVNDGCPAVAPDPAACNAAQKKLRKAKAKLKLLRRHDAKPAKIAKAKRKLKTAKSVVKSACA
jgi:hypothetical protein